MLEAFGLSDPGCVRSNNEDYYLLAPALGLFLVADGMGGAAAGECASQLAAETVGEYVRRTGKCDVNLLPNAFAEANRRVLEEASRDSALDGMGTTLVAVLDAGSELFIASVGDSRASPASARPPPAKCRGPQAVTPSPLLRSHAATTEVRCLAWLWPGHGRAHTRATQSTRAQRTRWLRSPPTAPPR